jgi:hypothetical protein
VSRTISVSLWRTDIDGNRLENLSRYLVSGGIEMNTDRISGKMSARFSLTEPTRVRPYIDFLVPTLTIEYDDGTPTVTKALGFYSTRTAPSLLTKERNEATYEVEDLTRLLSFSAYTAVDNVPAATNVVTEVEGTIAEAAITRHSLPTTSITTSKALTFPIGTSRLDKVNDLLGSIGWYSLYPRLDGKLTSKPYLDLVNAQPVMTITDASLLAPIQVQTNDQTLVNVVIVIREDPAQASLYAVARNDDPSSPTSTTNVGFEYTRIERVADLQTQTEVDSLAVRLLREARTYYQTATVRVWPDTDFGMHEVVDLDLTGKMASLNGRWWLRRWGLGLTPSSCYYDLELNRVTDANTGAML